MTIQKTIFALALALLAPSLHAKLPADAGFPLQKDHDAKKFAFLRAAGVEAYRKVGHRDAKWDAKAEQVIDSFDRRSAGQAPTRWANHIVRFADEAIAAGCQDPLVQFILATELLGQRDDAPRLLQSAIAGFEKHAYPPYRRFRAFYSLFELQSDDGNPNPEAAATWGLLRKAFNDLLAEEAFRKNRGLCVELIDELMADAEQSVIEELYSIVKTAENVDPVFRKAVEGIYHVKTAWHHRGGGWGNQVIDPRLFHEHLDRARAALTAAWEQDKAIPEICREMIAVCMGDHHRRDGNGERLWLERSMAARFDYMPSYHAFLLSIYPRWDGDLRKMMAFGVECAETKRFDTQVPAFLLQVMAAVRAEDHGQIRMWEQGDNAWDTRAMLEGYFTNSPDPEQRRIYHTAIVALAARLDELSVARKQLDAGGPDLDPRGAAFADYIPGELVGFVYASTGPAERLLSQADYARRRREFNDALDHIAKASAQRQDHPTATAYLKHLAAAVRTEASLFNGNTIDITPAADFLGWEAGGGEWSVLPETGQVVCRKPTAHAKLVCYAEFSPQWELQLELTPKAGDTGAFAIMFGPAGEPPGFGALVSMKERQLILVGGTGGADDGGGISKPARLPGKPFILTLRRIGNKLTASIDGNDLAAASAPKGFNRHQTDRLQFSVLPPREGTATAAERPSEIRFGKITLRHK